MRPALPLLATVAALMAAPLPAEVLDFEALDGWRDDNHLAALDSFLREVDSARADFTQVVTAPPKDGQAADMRWFDVDPCYVFHPCNAFELPDGSVVMDVVAHRRMFDRSRQGPEFDSGARFEPRPWPAALQALRARIDAAAGVAMNSVLANLYRDGRDAMGWHSDDEPELGLRPVIASLSLGGTRRFVFKHRRDPGRKFELPLEHGSLLLMKGDTQADWKHALPRTARPVPARVNLTFRRILPRAG